MENNTQYLKYKNQLKSIDLYEIVLFGLLLLFTLTLLFLPCFTFDFEGRSGRFSFFEEIKGCIEYATSYQTNGGSDNPIWQAGGSAFLTAVPFIILIPICVYNLIKPLLLLGHNYDKKFLLLKNESKLYGTKTAATSRKAYPYLPIVVLLCFTFIAVGVALEHYYVHRLERNLTDKCFISYLYMLNGISASFIISMIFFVAVIVVCIILNTKIRQLKQQILFDEEQSLNKISTSTKEKVE